MKIILEKNKFKYISLLLKLYVCIEIVLLLFSLFFAKSPFIYHISFVILLFFPLLPVLIFYHQKVKFIYKWFITWLILAVFFTINFRVFRSLFSSAEISSNKIIGFSHYFNYPQYYDWIFFTFFLLLPELIYYLFYVYYKNKKKHL
jgi:hypothetical protein